MQRKHFVGCVIVAALGAGLVSLAGCGGGGAGPLPSADVPLLATITTTADLINSVVVTTRVAGDEIDIAGATARVDRADGTSAAVTLTANAAGSQITLGQATVTSSTAQFNTLLINGPIRFTDGATNTTTVIGRLEFQFEVLADGTVVSPATVTVSIPTQGAAADRRVMFTGLSANPRDYVKTTIRDNGGGFTESSVHGADAQGRATLRDAQGSITAAVLSGNNSRITIMFARTDADSNGVPDLLE
jgi:hypothetical protein